MSGTIALAALCLLAMVTLSTFGLWFMFWRSSTRQADEMKKLRAAAADAANAGRSAAVAAKTSADALVSAERAYLFLDEDVEADLAGVSEPPGKEASTGNPNSVIKFTFLNRGRTPAILESIAMGVVPGLGPPATLESTMLALHASVPVGSVISANSRYERRLGCPFRLDAAALKQLEQRERRLYFLGRIIYKDVFGNSHETGFGLEFEPSTRSFMRVLSEQLNYYT